MLYYPPFTTEEAEAQTSRPTCWRIGAQKERNLWVPNPSPSTLAHDGSQPPLPARVSKWALRREEGCGGGWVDPAQGSCPGCVRVAEAACQNGWVRWFSLHNLETEVRDISGTMEKR